MPDGFGGFMTPILAAFDPDGRKTDQLTGKDDGTPNADGGGNMPNADPGTARVDFDGVQPGDVIGDGGFGVTYRAGVQRPDGTWTYDDSFLRKSNPDTPNSDYG